MCRLYALQATHPTRSACELLDAQNAMIQQSREDARGLSNPHGWGMGQVTDGTTSCFRQVEPASESESYREEALKTEGTTRDWAFKMSERLLLGVFGVKGR